MSGILSKLGSCLWKGRKLGWRSVSGKITERSDPIFSDAEILGELDASYEYNRTLYWRPSDQVRAFERLISRIDYIDAIVEMRDARIPLSSINPQFSEYLGSKPRLVAYNKADLSSPEFDWDGFSNNLQRHTGEEVIHMQAANSNNIDKIMHWAKDLAMKNPHLYPFMCLIVVGLPNVGKSTVINKLREKGVRGKKTLRVGANAGVTRSVQTRIMISREPPIYLVDTPGIFEPHFSHPVNSLKLALTGALKDTMIDPMAAADYLLHRINATQETRDLYTSYYGLARPVEKVTELLEVVALRFSKYNASKYVMASKVDGLVDSGDLEYVFSIADRKAMHRREIDSKYNLSLAALELIYAFREGSLGRFTLDDCSSRVMDAVFSRGGPALTLTARRFTKYRPPLRTDQKKKKGRKRRYIKRI